MASPAKHLKDIGMFGIKLNLGNYASPHAAGAYFHVMSIYMLIGFILLLCTYFGVHERVLPTEEETASVKFSDLWNELRRNKPLRVLGCFFLVGFTLAIRFGHSLFNTTLATRNGWLQSI